MSFGKGGPKEQVVTNKLDPATEAYRNEIFNRARSVSNQPYTGYNGQTVANADPASLGALSGMQGMGGVYGGITNGLGGPNIGPYAGAGANAARILSGDQGAIQGMMNPFQNQVIDALGTQYDRQRDKAVMQTNDQATQAGAFGGDRAALLAGERMGALDRGQMSDVANLLSGNYQNVMQNAQQTANLGLNAQGQLGNFNLGMGNLRLGAAQGQQGALQDAFGMGDYLHGINQQKLNSSQQQFNEQRDWGLRGLNILQGGLSGMPYGNTESQPLYKNGFNSVAGGAATGYGIAGPYGALAGGIGGLLFG
jgi:hypothetical protein